MKPKRVESSAPHIDRTYEYRGFTIELQKDGNEWYATVYDEVENYDYGAQGWYPGIRSALDDCVFVCDDIRTNPEEHRDEALVV